MIPKLVSRAAIAATMIVASSVASAQAKAPGYHVIHRITTGGDGGWDYVIPDAPNHRLFIGRQNRVMVVDMNNGRLIADVTGIKGAHGTALAPATSHGFATSGNDSSIVMFDLKTYRTLARIPAAEDADAIIYDPASKRIFSFNGDANSSTVVDPSRERSSPTSHWAASPNTGSRRGTERST